MAEEKQVTKKKVAPPRPLIINEREVMPGEHAVIGVNVGSLPSSTPLYMNIFVFRAEQPGSTILVSGGLHGDEITGVDIVRRSLASGMFGKLTRGSVVAIPLINVYGFINFSREVPDGKDVNRSFPGNSRGSLASRVAAVITRKVLPSVDIVLDFHAGGHSHYNYPQVRYTRISSRSFELARAFGTRFILQKPLISKSLRMVANSMSIPILVFEGGEALRHDGLSVTKGVQGIQNVLLHRKMLSRKDFKMKREKSMFLIEKSSWIRASDAGIFTWTMDSGSKVEKGDVLGVINDPYGGMERLVKANRSGYIVGHNNASVVNPGDALFNVAYDYQLLEKK